MRKVVVNILSAVFVMAVCISCGSGGSRSAKITMTTEQGGRVSFDLGGNGIATVDWGDGSERVSLTLDGGARFEHTYPNATMRTIRINGDNITALSTGYVDFSSSGSIELTSLDLSRNTELTQLSVVGHQLTSLDLRNNTALTFLGISSFSLTSLDLSRNTELEWLMVRNTSLTDLDLSRNTALKELSVDLNFQLTGLNVSNSMPALTSVNVSNNQLTTSTLNALIESLPQAQVDGWSRSWLSISNNPGANEANRSIAEAKGWNVSWQW